MRRKLILSVILMLILVALTIAYVALEPGRQAAAAKRQQDEAVTKGTRLYAGLCMSCHGPRGAGAVGTPLDRAVFRQGGPDELKGSAELLREIIRSGRSGTAVPSFLRAADGAWISRTAMPPWSQERGGPLTAQEIDDVVAFIQYGDWNKPAASAPRPKLEGQPPVAQSLSAQDAERGLELFRAKACLSCHALGNMGGKQGPDLSQVGGWRDADYLRNWIKDPSKVDRSNYIWSSGQKVSMGKPAMPAVPMTDVELKVLVDYLAALAPAPAVGQAPAATPAATLPTATSPAATKPAVTPTAVAPAAAPTSAPPAALPTPTLAAPVATPTVAAPAPAVPTKPAAAAGDPVLGKAVFDANCTACHPGGQKGVGPSLVGAVSQRGETSVTNRIRNGRESMPPFPETTISAKQLGDLIAYLATLQ